MQKKNWKVKRLVNEALSKLRGNHRVLKVITKIVFHLRFLVRLGKKPPADNIGGIMVNDTYKLLCVGNPKVGSSSLKAFFQEELPSSAFYLNISYASFLRSNPDKHNYLKTAFVRNSWERIYSCWQDKISNNQRFSDMFIITRFKGLYPDMPFDEFVDWLCSEAGSDQYADRHWMSQHKLLDIDADRNNLDLVDDISNMNRQIEKIIAERNMSEAKLTQRNKSGRTKQTYNFTPAVIEKIALRYAEDIKLFEFRRPD